MPTILIADDEESLRVLVFETIESEEYDIVEAENGDDALQLLKEHRPVLALLDVSMPGQTGLELTRTIREDPDLAATKVILLTAKALQTDLEAGMAAGADMYLTKPFSPLELLDVIEETLSHV